MSMKKKNEKFNQLSPHLTGLKILFGSKYWLWTYRIEKLSFATPYHISDQVSKYADSLYRTESVLSLWDMFGGIGTDSINFSRYFTVMVTELDQQTHKCLLKNLQSFNVHNVNAILGNCLSYLDIILPDVIYFDPPWGDTYKNKASIFDFDDVLLDYPTKTPNLPVKIKCTDLIKYIYDHVCSNIIIKSPINSDSFEKVFTNKITYIFRFPNKNLKFIFLL